MENESIEKIADRLANPNLDELVKSMQIEIQKHAHYSPSSRKAESIIESRFTTAQKAYDLGLTSCGNMVNIVTEMLRHLGYAVKLIHGSVPQSPTHAWIKVKDKDDSWHLYDVTRKDLDVTREHKAEYEVNSWEEIRPIIEKIHTSE